MKRNVTPFDTRKHHIHMEFTVDDLDGLTHGVAGVLDTGAPKTEFSDQFLLYAGIIESVSEKTKIRPGLQTQKYGVLTLPSIEICGHRIDRFEILVSRFEKSWGIDALIGLIFFVVLW